MVELASPSPHHGPPQVTARLRWSRLAAWLGVSLLAVVLLGAVLIWTAPRWAAGRIQAELEQRVATRLDADVEIGELRFDWRQAELRDVTLRREGVKLGLDRVVVTLDRMALWSARFEVVEMQALGGQLEGERAGVEALADRLRGLSGEDDEEGESSWLRRRLRLRPDALELRGLAFALDDGERRATGSLAATVEPEHERVELRITSLLAELGLGRPLRAASLRTTLEQDGESLRFPLAIEVSGVAADLNENIAVAGVHGMVTLSDAKLREFGVELAGGFAKDGEEDTEPAGTDLWSISGRFARDLSVGKIAVEMQNFELGRVPEVLANLPLVDSERATVGGQLKLDFAAGVAEVDGQLTIAGLNVSHELLAREVVRDIGFNLDIDATLDPAGRKLVLERLSIERAGVELLARGELVHTPERETRRYQVELEVPVVGCQTVLDAIPRELIPGLQGFALAGKFSTQLTINIDFSRLEELELKGKVGIDGCRVSAAPRLASAERLRRGFVHRVTMRDGRTRRLSLYPGSSSYTPLANISRYMSEAVLTTEDGGFRRHDGFNYTQLEVALRRNLQDGRVRLGASTITMQMVKNVLLSHERTLSRKLQELFLTWWVEQALSKQRIMELYLNVIEFGPGVYGVTNAARHYFGKHPSELNSLEAAYLALMLPSPVRRHVHYCNDGLSQRFSEKLHYIHNLMRERGRISAIEHQVYAGRAIEFDPLERGDAQACLAEIETLMAGSQTQRALSGLLGDDDELEPPGNWALTAASLSPSWGVVPPLPDWESPDASEGPSASPDADARLEPRDSSWMVPEHPIDQDPANADAPGRPAMDELSDIG